MHVYTQTFAGQRCKWQLRWERWSANSGIQDALEVTVESSCNVKRHAQCEASDGPTRQEWKQGWQVACVGSSRRLMRLQQLVVFNVTLGSFNGTASVHRGLHTNSVAFLDIIVTTQEPTLASFRRRISSDKPKGNTTVSQPRRFLTDFYHGCR